MQQNETVAFDPNLLLHYDLLLERGRQQHLSQKNRQFSEYMKRLETLHNANFFISLNSWEKSKNAFALKQLLCNKKALTEKGGYFFRYKQTGVLINPSQNFLDTFSSLGFHLWHIDAVVITKDSSDSSAQTRLIHQLNKELNTTLYSNNCPPHVIRYFLHPDSYNSCAKDVRPTFKEERESLICLETFDSVETKHVSEAIAFDYKNGPDCAHAIRFSLDNGKSLGFALNGDTLEANDEFFAPCTCLITTPHVALAPSEHTALVLVSEFDASEGDTRIEEIKRMRYQNTKRAVPIFPLDTSLTVDLDTLSFHVAQNPESIEPDELVVGRSASFGPLFFSTCNQML